MAATMISGTDGFDGEIPVGVPGDGTLSSIFNPPPPPTPPDQDGISITPTSVVTSVNPFPPPFTGTVVDPDFPLPTATAFPTDPISTSFVNPNFPTDPITTSFVNPMLNSDLSPVYPAVAYCGGAFGFGSDPARRRFQEEQLEKAYRKVICECDPKATVSCKCAPLLERVIARTDAEIAMDMVKMALTMGNVGGLAEKIDNFVQSLEKNSWIIVIVNEMLIFAFKEGASKRKRKCVMERMLVEVQKIVRKSNELFQPVPIECRRNSRCKPKKKCKCDKKSKRKCRCRDRLESSSEESF